MVDDRMALWRTSNGALDDVVVQQVSMFRAEVHEDDRVWLCCYLPGTGVNGDRVAFDITAQDGKIEFEVVEMPNGLVSIEPPAR